MSEEKCEKCVNYLLKIGKEGWASSEPHPCSYCVYNQPILEDNFILSKKINEQFKGNCRGH